MSDINYYQYERCSVCDGRGLIEIAGDTEYNNICPCPLCSGKGNLPTKIEPDDIC